MGEALSNRFSDFQAPSLLSGPQSLIPILSRRTLMSIFFLCGSMIYANLADREAGDGRRAPRQKALTIEQ